MSEQITVRLSDETHKRLVSMAASTGRTATDCILEAINTYLDDIEDIYLGERALGRLRNGDDKVLTSEEFWHNQED
jgi:RHH-type rel operon transcriptional repressor/antitoxin RelB